MSTTRFLFVYRAPVESRHGELATGKGKPSPSEMQAMYAEWMAWRAKFDEEILAAGEGLKPGGAAAVVKDGAVTDGPYVESKEIMGGYTIIETTSLERALVIAKECPVARELGSSVEIRELLGRGWTP